MAMRSIPFLCASFLLASCKDNDKPALTGTLGTMGPKLGPDGQVLSNLITFDYKLEVPRQVQFWVEGKHIKSVEIDGNGSWRIEIAGETLKISDDALIFEVPIEHDGLLGSNSSVNEAGYRGWDISIDGHNIVRLQTNPSAGNE
ncbi:MAG: hypothetical protein MUF31_05595 [Akkermansiaceae bacterium]|jgi:hypothetical protein|nr:hypothetical protein [Akkermansiaceae bacterium]